MDKLYIKALSLKTTIGCLEWEKQILQTVIAHLEMHVDCKTISALDTIDATIDYAGLAAQLSAFAATQRCQLIETLAEKMVGFIHQHYPTISHIKLSLEKPGAIPHAQTVGVMIERDYA